MDARQELEDLRRLHELETRAKETGLDSPTMSVKQAAIEGLKKGGSLGFSDRIGGVIDAGLKVSGDLLVPEGGKNPFQDQSYSDTYNQGVQDERNKYAKASKDQPATTFISTLIGGIPTAARTGVSTAASVGLGAVTGLGSTEDLTNIPQTTKDVALGTVIGYAASEVPDVAKYIYSKLRPTAEKLAVNATGATGLQASKFSKNAGSELLDRGLVKFGDTPENIAKRAGHVLKQTESSIDSSLAGLESKGANVSANEILSNLSKQIDKLKGDPSQASVVRKLTTVMDDIKAAHPSQQTVRIKGEPGTWFVKDVADPGGTLASNQIPDEVLGYYKDLSNFGKTEKPPIQDIFGVDSVPNIPPTPEVTPNLYTITNAEGVTRKVPATQLEGFAFDRSIPISKAEEIKRGFNKMAGNWQDPEAGAAGKMAYRGYRDAVENTAQKIDPDIAQQFIEAKKTYGLLDPIRQAAERRSMQLNQSPIGGLLDTAAAVAGIATGNPITGVAVAGARRFLAPRISSSAAVSLNALSNVLGSGVEKLSPAIQNQLIEASKKGSRQLAITHFILQSQNPEYQNIMNQDKK